MLTSLPPHFEWWIGSAWLRPLPAHPTPLHSSNNFTLRPQSPIVTLPSLPSQYHNTPNTTRQHKNGLPIRHARRPTDLPPIGFQPPQSHAAPPRIHRTALPRSRHKRPSRQRCRRRAERFRKTMEFPRRSQDGPLLGSHHEGMLNPSLNISSCLPANQDTS